MSTTRSGADLAIRLDVDRLGTIEVKLAKNADGATAVSVASDREDTIRAIAADRSGMQAILQDAGIDSEHGRIEYSILPSANAGGSPGDMTSSGGGMAGGQGGGSGHTSTDDRARSAPDAVATVSRVDRPSTPERPITSRDGISRTSVDINA